MIQVGGCSTQYKRYPKSAKTHMTQSPAPQKKPAARQKPANPVARTNGELVDRAHAKDTQAAAGQPRCQPAPLAASASTSTSGTPVKTELGSSAKSKAPSPVREKHQALMERVYRELEERERLRRTPGVKAPMKPVVMWERISFQAFQGWLLKYSEEEKLRWDYEALDENTGRVVVYELPTSVHTSASRHIMQQILDGVSDAGGNTDRNVSRQRVHSLVQLGDADLVIGDRLFRPDESLNPSASARDRPTLVVEVAYSETLDHLRAKLYDIMTDRAIQIAIGVKIPYRTPPDCDCRSIIVLQRRKNGNLDRKYEQTFGAGIEPPKRLPSFPIWKMYVGTRLPPVMQAIRDELIVIDLQLLDQAITAYERRLTS